MALGAPGKCLSCTHKRMESRKQECMQLQRAAAACFTTVVTATRPSNQWMKYLEQTCWRLTKIYEPTKLHAPVMRYWAMLWRLLVKGYWTMLWKLLVKAGMNASLLQYFGGWAENRVFLKFFFFSMVWIRALTCPRQLYSSTSSSNYSLPGGTASD